MIVYFIGMLIGSFVFHSDYDCYLFILIPDSFYELLPCNFFDDGYLQRVGTNLVMMCLVN